MQLTYIKSLDALSFIDIWQRNNADSIPHLSFGEVKSFIWDMYVSIYTEENSLYALLQPICWVPNESMYASVVVFPNLPLGKCNCSRAHTRERAHHEFLSFLLSYCHFLTQFFEDKIVVEWQMGWQMEYPLSLLLPCLLQYWL